MKSIYVAGPLFNSHERWFLEQIAMCLEIAGFKTFLPHRDAGLVDFSKEGEQSRIFNADIKALDEADMVVALLTGADHDSGTCGELGYAYAKGKLCIGISDDFRYRNNLIWGLCGEGKHVVKNLDELMAFIQTLDREN
jgi:nucleoside 2-deoxyribosyltransferase